MVKGNMMYQRNMLEYVSSAVEAQDVDAQISTISQVFRLKQKAKITLNKDLVLQ